MEARKTVPLIVASAIIMQQIDSTSLTIALPSIATSFDVPVLRLHSAITIYLLSLGVFLPLSGWTADRFGARNVFCAAIAIFTLASLLCAVSTSLTTLIIPRVLQGLGGAMMLPVGRLILVRSVSRAELVSAMVLMSLPTVIGPAVGPLLGGFILSITSWHWIFLINLPVGILGIALAMRFIEDIPPAPRKPFDFPGFVMSGAGIGAVIFGLDSASHGSGLEAAGFAAAGGAILWAYVLYARRTPNAILDLALFRFSTFRASILGGSLFRLGFGALPFMLPVLLQEVFGYSPFASGVITFASAVGAFGMRTVARRILHRFGFRQVLLWNTLIASASMGLCAAFTQSTPPLVMMLVILAGGVFRALQFISVNTLAFAEVAEDEMSQATTISQMAQRISQSCGVAFAATLLHFYSSPGPQLTEYAFMMAFLIVAFVSSMSCLSFIAMDRTAGDELAGRVKKAA